MDWFTTILLATAIFVTLVSVGIGLDTMRRFSPALAKLVRSDYSAMERHYDHLGQQGDEGGVRFKRVSMRIEFDTPDQKQVRVHHRRWQLAGERQKSCYFIWFDKENPEKTTAYGPGFWLVVAAFSASVAVTIMLDPAGWVQTIRGLLV
ncbi:hypothetical protein GCM10009096_13200 [Parasphingorhabdus litoris]|uniref:DUF3592 domain-containing protein n=1 Tax=Parasphingorhabdus litoris TaxID=394733 RepID=A0ABN1ACP6_9SPHN|nr:hypothetical protein [Parasphingorhabdus litoris]